MVVNGGGIQRGSKVGVGIVVAEIKLGLFLQSQKEIKIYIIN